ncbi:hypothetical protein KBI23_03730 [bacterium]|nr:hypothetical protein [bacterium]MBP9810020.1 hypothetical protein [bacterium]
MIDLRFHEENLSKHGIKPEEVEECFSDVRRLVRKIGEIYWLIGKTEAGRLLQVGYRKEVDRTYFVFHAMAAREHELKRYKSRGK